MTNAVVIAVYVMLALGLNIVVGFAGLLDLGFVAFYALGAYVVGWFASTHFNEVSFRFLSALPAQTSGRELPGIHISFWILLIAAGAFAALWGVIIGAPTLRSRGDYLAIVTLGFGDHPPLLLERVRPTNNKVLHTLPYRIYYQAGRQRACWVKTG